MAAQRQFIQSNQTRGLRLVQSLNIPADNQAFQIDLPRGPAIEYAVVRVTGSITNTVAWAGGNRNNGPYHYLRNAQWVINNNVVLDNVSGIQTTMTYFTRRNVPTAANPATGVGATTFTASWIFDRTLLDMMRPKDSMLKTDIGVSQNQLKLQFGAIADMFQPGAGAATYTSVTASVFVGDYQEARDSSGNTPAPLYYVKRNGFRQAFSAASAGQQIKLNTGNRLRSVSIVPRNATTGEPDAALITRIGLQRAGDQRVNMTYADLMALNATQYGTALANTGQAVIDLANPGNLGARYSEFWPIPSNADTFLIVDTSAACIIDLVTLEGVDLRRAA